MTNEHGTKAADALIGLNSALNLFLLHHMSSKHIEIKTEKGERVPMASAYAPFFRYISIHEGEFKSLFDDAQARVNQFGDTTLADSIAEALTSLQSTKDAKTFEEVESLAYTCVDTLRGLRIQHLR